jgi:hypothetical protein
MAKDRTPIAEETPAPEPTMKIEVLEAEIKQAPYGVLKQGETRVVGVNFGRFACANGWARDLSGEVETGERGSQDYANPEEWTPETPQPRRLVQPRDGRHLPRST